MINFKESEKEIRKFWEENKIYEKVKEKNKSGKKFYFLQGPPYTSGKLHIGHAWNNSLKDMILRYKRLQEFNVWDRAGYDMHGLPTENKVQKKLGFKNKDEIIAFGVGKFVEECMEFCKEYAGYMNEDLWNLGIWMDYKNAYMPIKKEFIGGEWLFFKKAWEQNRLYKGKKIMHWDAQSETSMAKHELEYEIIKDTSVYLKFKNPKTENEYFVVWTTTPWTIPFNLAVMVNPDVKYAKVKVDEEIWIVAEPLVESFVGGLLGKEYEILSDCLGSELEGLKYENPLYSELKEQYDSLGFEKIHSIILSKEFVDVEWGTGLVHCAPGCGPEDFEVGQKYGLGAFNKINEQGIFEGMGKFTGWAAKEDDVKFIKEFADLGCLVGKKKIEHEYPFSWRSHKPIVFRPTEQWFLKTEDLIPELLKFNKKVYWSPKKSGESYRQWTENLRDNGLTRQRFWGCPVPIWVNVDNSEDFIVLGSVEELESFVGRKLEDIELHRPKIDEFIIEKSGKKYKRIPDVSDVWIDSGTTSWNCLYNDPELIKKYFPADFILEATEQTRQWFSMLQICSAIVFGESAYKNVFVHGMMLDYQGIKMSKSLGNVISPYEVVDKYSADILRYYICQTTAGENISFNWEDVKVKQRNLIILSNIANYILDLEKQEIPKGEKGLEEKWILSKYNSALKEVTKLFDEYKLDEVIGEIEKLFMTLSRDYIKLVREKSSENSAVLETVKEIYTGILKMFSTIVPFVSEKIWQDLKSNGLVSEESVHLCSWPEFSEDKVDLELEKKFDIALKVIEIGLRERDRSKIGLRWPLSKAEVSCSENLEEFKEIISRQLNVKKIEFREGDLEVKLDTKITPDLEAEGFSRELARKVQSMRKDLGLEKSEEIRLEIYSKTEINKMFKENEEFIKERTGSKRIDFIDGNVDEKEEGAFKIKEKIAKVRFS